MDNKPECSYSEYLIAGSPEQTTDGATFNPIPIHLFGNLMIPPPLSVCLFEVYLFYDSFF